MAVYFALPDTERTAAAGPERAQLTSAITSSGMSKLA
jgi:hypothetical protein